MTKDEHIKLTEEIVETAYKLLTQKLAFGGLIAKNEAAFQLEFGYILKNLWQLYEFGWDDKFHLEFETYIPLNEKSIKSGSNQARVDLYLEYKCEGLTTKTVIELKFYKKENGRGTDNRYDAFKDISNLEKYKKHDIDLCYFILATNDPHYVDKDAYSPKTGDFDFRDGVKYEANTILEYKPKKKNRPNIELTKDYKFKWDKVNTYSFLKLKV
jgi:hypothetical protein